MVLASEHSKPASEPASAPARPEAAGTNRAPRAAPRRILLLPATARRFIAATFFSSLTQRIVILNLVGLATLVAGILYFNQWRDGLIDARVQSMRIQGEIISAAIAADAKLNSDVIEVNPDRLLELLPGNNVSPLSFFDPTLEFPINPEEVAPLLGELVTPTKTRARIYDRDGFLILDSANIYAQGQLLQSPPRSARDTGFFLLDWWNTALSWVPGTQFPLYQEYDASQGKRYPEVGAALAGSPADLVRVDEHGQLVVMVAVPVQRQRAIIGVLLLSTRPGDIDAIIATERLGILRIALIAALVTSVLSFFLAGTIADPVRRLSAAAERVQVSMNNRAEIPDFTDRPDEIGHLSGALRAMTNALYNRIEAIERFAADVAHEIKNPLTSLRSAVETLPLVKKKADRERLVAIIQHDVRRLDRLISDISNASRLDAELARENAEPIDIVQLAEAMISIHQETAAARRVEIVFEHGPGRYPLVVTGHDSRLAQVFSNLIDNAVSFSPEGGRVTVSVMAGAEQVTATIADEGPGIKGDATRIFQRFYTDRPDTENFGDHSGLGLSISRQIVEAHKGTIRGENRTDRSGAIFTIVLPRPKK